MILNAKQLSAVTRFNREFSVLKMELENVDHEYREVLVRATLNTKSQKVKAFYLDKDGGLAGKADDEDSQTNP